MAISYTIDEVFDGKRTNQMPDIDNEGETINVESDVRDIKVTFNSTSPDPVVTHTRNVNVCYTEAGEYDATATIARIEEVKLGFANKVACGLFA